MFTLRLLPWAALLFAFSSTWLKAPSALAQSDSLTPALQSDGLTDLVQWDINSVLVNGERIFLFTGEMHYWRIPVPGLWRDILEKIKAAGFAGFTFYSSWGWHAFNSTSLDFESGAHNIVELYELAAEIGLYFILRPGPYINAEANAGGYPLWATTGEYGPLRDNGSAYTDAYSPYVRRFSEISLPYLITNGGNGILYQIENEFGEQWEGEPADRDADPVASEYMATLERVVRDSGIDIPTYFNNPNLDTKSWSEDFAPGYLGNTDLNGADSYPSCWTCNHTVCGEVVPYQVVNYYDYFSSVHKTMPYFLPEFQGGSFNPWGGPEGGCPRDIGADYANMFYRHNVGEGVTAVNLYMMYGGTNWGAFAAPVVATSYDYSAPISEDRSISSKYHETKMVALFTRAARDLTETVRVANGTELTTNPAVSATELRNPSTNAAFYVTIHRDSTSATLESFKLHVNTSEGLITVPQKAGSIVLDGHQSKIIATDFSMGQAKLVYSTAEILSYIVTDGEPTLFLWVPAGESAEFYMTGVEYEPATHNSSSESSVQSVKNGALVNVANVEGSSVFQFSSKSSHGWNNHTGWNGHGQSDVRVVLMDRPTAQLSWVPTLTNNPQVSANDTVYVQGPYLVRGASMDGQILCLTGDANRTTTIEAYAPKEAKEISWNGHVLPSHFTSHGSLTATVAAPPQVELPPLEGWKSADSLPEKDPSYDASGPAWISADHMDTPNPIKPVTYPVLYADEYGFHNGPFLWRGQFQGHAAGVRLQVQGGYAFGWSAWLNGDFVGSFLGSYALESGNMSLSFANATVDPTGDNVLLVVQDNTGHDQIPDYLNPRGILGAALLNSSSDFTSWKIAGNAGGDRVQLDPIRGPLAEGGFTAERLGWHLPDFDDSDWESQAPSNHVEGAGVTFYRTVVPLSIPEGLDVSISFTLSTPGTKKFRTMLFVNGYQYGRFSPWIGNQVVFPVPPGVLDYTGDNTIGLSVWAQSEEGAEIGVEWNVNYVTGSNLNVRTVGDGLRPGWTSERLEYA